MCKRFLLLLFWLSISFFSSAQVSGLVGEIPALIKKFPALHPDTAKLNASLKIAGYYLFAADIIGQDDSAGIYLRYAKTLNQNYHIEQVDHHIELLQTSIKEDTSQEPFAYRAFIPLITKFSARRDPANERLAWQLLAENIHDPSLDSLKLSAYQHARSLARNLGDTEQELECQVFSANIYFEERKFDTSKKELLEVISRAGSLPGPLTDAYDVLAAIYLNHGDMDSALQYSRRSQRLREASGDTTKITNSYNNLSRIFYVLKQNDQALIWDKKALQHCLWTGKYNILWPILGSVVANMLQLQKADSALAYVDSIAQKVKLASTEDNRVINKIYGKIFLALKEYGRAEDKYRQSISFGKAEGTQYPIDAKVSDYRALGLIYFQTGKYNAAKAYLDSSLNICGPTGRADFLLAIHQDLCKVDSAMGDYRSALAHLQAAHELSLTLYNKERNKSIEQLTYQYKTEEREKDLRLLQKEQMLANQQLMIARATRNWIVAASILLLLIAILLYRQSQIRQKTNITMTQKNTLLEKLLGEKEWLLKEVHHRVKNNLHTIVSLLESQAAFLNEDALQAVEKSQHRVYAMSLVHQKLYRQDDLRTIDMSLYLREFLQYLGESFGPPPNIHISTTIDPVKLDVTRAIAVGMITNEAVTNSVKYAFPEGLRGEISVTLLRNEDQIKLAIADNGIGMIVQGSNAEINSLGIELMKGFARDLEGSIKFDNRLGTIVTVTFPYEGADSDNEVDNLKNQEIR